MKKAAVFILFLLSGAAGFFVSWHMHKPVRDKQSVQQIETFHYPALFVHQLQHDPRAGEKIFNEFCSACHASSPLIDVNAPRINDREAWKIRQKWGIDALMTMTLSGVGAMPARGGCFECSDAQLKEAVLYILKGHVAQ